MSVPAVHTDATLSEHILQTLGSVADTCEWTAGGAPYQHIIARTLRAYGVSDIANATDATKLEALADVEAWRRAITDLATRYDVSTDGQSLSRSQMLRAAKDALDDALNAVRQYRYAYAQYPITYLNDPAPMRAATTTED